MRPGFELMGNPGSLFDDLDSNPETLLLWQSFVADLASHYIGKVTVKVLSLAFRSFGTFAILDPFY